MAKSRVDDFVIKNEASALRRRTDALLVVVITPEKVLYSEDPKMRPNDIQRILEDETATLAEDIRARRSKGGAR